jgi:hypothetical protein
MPKPDFTVDPVVSAEWLNAQQEHVHDGADDIGSAPKIRPEHMQWGDNGNIILTDDPADSGVGPYHNIGHISTGAGVLSRFTSNILRANANKIQMGARVLLESVIGTLIDLELKDEDGTPLLTRVVADALRVRSSTLPPGASAVDTLVGANLVKAAGSILLSTGGSSPVFVIASNSHNIASVTRVDIGKYQIQFSTAIDTHGDFSVQTGRCITAMLGTDSGTAPTALILNAGELIGGSVTLWSFGTTGNAVDLPVNSIINIMVL